MPFEGSTTLVLLSSKRAQLRVHVDFVTKKLSLSVLFEDGSANFYSADQFGEALDEYERLNNGY